MTTRLVGIDIARFIAFCGMVIVNFKIVMGVEANPSVAFALTSLLEGKAAATFVILAGLGLGLSAKAASFNATLWATTKRAAFLLALGLLNMTIFDADIIHFYAFYFLFGALLLPLSSKHLLATICALNFAFLLLLFVIDYETGWNFETLAYTDLWTLPGFFRHVFYNGWHPVVPWLSLFLFGLWLARLQLSEYRTQLSMLGSGVALLLASAIAAALVRPLLSSLDTELGDLATTGPMPPTIFYIMTGLGAGLTTLSLCLLSTRATSAPGKLLTAIAASGRQTLTLYIAHILIGMGTLEAFGLIGGQNMENVLAAWFVFCMGSLTLSHFWFRRWDRGPLEALMRRLAG